MESDLRDQAVQMLAELTALRPGERGVLITGESGVGRTRFVRELAQAASGRMPVAFVSVRPGRDVPWWTVRDLLLRLAPGTRGRPTSRLPPEGVERVAATSRLLCELLPSEPLLLILDDVHRCDPDSAAVLGEFLETLLPTAPPADPGHQAVVVCTAPSGQPGAEGGALHRLLARLPRQERVPLGPDATARLARDTLGLAPAPGFAADLHAATGGNPSAVLGVLADARRSGALQVVGEYAAVRPERRLQLSRDHVLVDRVDELPGRAGAVARLLAPAGACAPAALLAELPADLTPEQFTQALEVLRHAGLLESSADGGTVQLARPALRDALCRRMPPWQRARIQSRMLSARIAGRAAATGAATAGTGAATAGAGAATAGTAAATAVAGAAIAGTGADRGLLELAARATALGKPLDGAADPLAPVPDGGDATDTPPPGSGRHGALAGELLELTDFHPDRERIVLQAVRHWARTGQWTRIAALPEHRLGDALIPYRARALLLTAGVGRALTELERIAASANGERARLIQAELLALTGRSERAEAVLQAVGVTGPQPFEPGRVADGSFRADGREAFRAWRTGRWSDLRDLAHADRLLNRSAHELCNGEEAAALAAQAQLDRGRPLSALRHLDACPPSRSPEIRRTLLDWARAGVELALGRADDAVALLAQTARWQRHTGCEHHLGLVLSRLVRALSATGDFSEADRVLSELSAWVTRHTESDDDALGADDAFRRTLWLGARVEWARARGQEPDRALLSDYLRAAQRADSPFALARARLTVGWSTDEPRLLSEAREGFAELGATLWQLRVDGLLKRLGSRSAPVVAAERADRVVAEFVACGLSNASVAELLLQNEAYVKRRVSRLLVRTGSRSRAQLAVRYAEEVPAELAPPPLPGDVAPWLASSTEAVTVLVGPSGSGRSTVLAQTRMRIAAAATAPLVLGRSPHGGRFRLASALLSQLSGQGDSAQRHGGSRPARGAGPGPGTPDEGPRGRLAVLDSLLAVLEDACRRGPVTLLVDDIDALDVDSRAMLPVLAERARAGAFRLVVAVPSRRHAALIGQPARVLPLPAMTEGAVRRRLAALFGPDTAESATEATAAAVRRRTGGWPGLLRALIDVGQSGPGASRMSAADRERHVLEDVLDPATAAPLRPVAALPPEQAACAALFAALPGLRMPEAELVAQQWRLPARALHAAANRLYEAGLLDADTAGGLRFAVPLCERSVATTVDRAAVTTAHAALARRQMAAPSPVDEERLAEHLASAGGDFGRRRLAETAARTLTADPERAQRWCAALLAAGPADPSVRASAMVTSAQCLYLLSRYTEAAAVARDALALLPADEREARLASRTVLTNSLIRTGEHDVALRLSPPASGTSQEDAGPEPEPDAGQPAVTPELVLQGLQEARVLVLQERFDEALRVLGTLTPERREHKAAVLAGVRLIAALSSDGLAHVALERTADPAATKLTQHQVQAARDALTWGDMYTAERELLSGGYAASASRREPPAAFARLTAAVAGLHSGDWPSVLRAADENTTPDGGLTYVDDVLAALGAEVLVRWGRLEEAGERLREVRGERMFGHLVAWARGGWQLASGEPAAAVRTLTEAEDRCAGLGYLPGRDLLLRRLVDAESASGNRNAAERTLDRLATVVHQIDRPRATLGWLLRRCMLLGEAQAARRAVHLAAQQHDRFSLARAQVYAATLDVPEDALLRSAYQTFEDLGAVAWVERAARAMQSAGMAVRNADALTPRDRELVELIAGGATNAQAATAMHVTEKAIEVRLTRLYHRTGAHSRVELVRRYGHVDGGQSV